MKKHIITIAGKLGSGKSSTAKELANRLGYSHFSSGDFMRSLADDRGMTLQELSTRAETDLSIDHAIDEKVIEAGNYENRVIDTRLGFHFIPQSFKVYLELDTKIASQRIWNDRIHNPNRHTEDLVSSPDEIAESIEKRLASEKKRYQELYQLDHTDHNHFDLVIDTEKNNLESVVEQIMDAYHQWLSL